MFISISAYKTKQRQHRRMKKEIIIPYNKSATHLCIQRYCNLENVCSRSTKLASLTWIFHSHPWHLQQFIPSCWNLRFCKSFLIKFQSSPCKESMIYDTRNHFDPRQACPRDVSKCQRTSSNLKPLQIRIAQQVGVHGRSKSSNKQVSRVGWNKHKPQNSFPSQDQYHFSDKNYCQNCHLATLCHQEMLPHHVH